jgi:hypothetical protein
VFSTTVVFLLYIPMALLSCVRTLKWLAPVAGVGQLAIMAAILVIIVEAGINIPHTQDTQQGYALATSFSGSITFFSTIIYSFEGVCVCVCV